MVDKFRTKRGDLTPYALACGYEQQQEINNIRVSLWGNGGPVYHVRAHDFNTHARVFWKSSLKLTECRQWYKQYVKHLKEVHDDDPNG